VTTVLDIVLAPAVLAVALMVAALLFAVRSIIRCTAQAAELRLRLNVVQARLDRLTEALPDKKRRIAELTTSVAALSPIEERLRRYYDTLADLNIETEKAQHQAEEQERMKRERLGARGGLGTS